MAGVLKSRVIRRLCRREARGPYFHMFFDKLSIPTPDLQGSQSVFVGGGYMGYISRRL